MTNEINTKSIEAALARTSLRFPEAYPIPPTVRTLGNGERQIFNGGAFVHVSHEGYVTASGAYAELTLGFLLARGAIGPLPRTNTARRVYVAR